MYSSPSHLKLPLRSEMNQVILDFRRIHTFILSYILRERRDLHFHLTIWVLCNFLDQLLPTRPAEPPHEPRHHGCGRGPRCHRHGRCSQCGSWQGCRSSLRGLEKHQFLELLLDRPQSWISIGQVDFQGECKEDDQCRHGDPHPLAIRRHWSTTVEVSLLLYGRKL